MPQYDAVLFDCDGVIVDSEPPAFELMIADFRAHGVTLSDAEIEETFIGGTIPGVFERARAMGVPLPDGWPDDFYDRLYARLAQGVPLVAGVEALLDRLDAAGVPYAIGSNGSLRKMEITLGQHPRLRDRFAPHIYSGQELGRPKPAPDLYLHAAAALGVAPARAAVVEDSPTGAEAARAAGMDCFGHAGGHAGPARRLAERGARVFHRMDELPALLGL
ncbi:HAD family hydrolase [Frigidibacter sp. MR17.24]|uniref:HAD family hydrolase n=1 Tax=Frigidibacter sp. MR17.24 TaxID=3127345 RepID=UPI003012FA76